MELSSNRGGSVKGGDSSDSSLTPVEKNHQPLRITSSKDEKMLDHTINTNKLVDEHSFYEDKFDL